MSEHLRLTIARRALAVAGTTLLTGSVLLGQAPAASTGSPQPPAGASAAPQPAPSAAAPSAPGAAGQAAAPAPEPAYSYNAAGRRDPFVSLLGRGSDGKPSGSRPAGVAGLMINETSIKGIIRDRSGFIAMVQGADNRTYVVRAGDRLMDGTVKAIVQDAVVFSQDVNDPLSLVKQKEIRKNLRSPEGGRG